MMKLRFVNIYMINVALLLTILCASVFNKPSDGMESLIGVLDSGSYQCTIHSKSNPIYEGEKAVVAPYDITYDYTRNGKAQTWGHLQIVGDTYSFNGVAVQTSEINNVLNLITIQESEDSTFSYRINKSTQRGDTKNPYKLIDEIKGAFNSMLSEEEIKTVGNMILEEILDTRSLFYKLRTQLDEQVKSTETSGGTQRLIYDNARIEITDNSWRYEDNPSLGVTHLYEIDFKK